ncbi:hypothetical protein GCM10010528_12490 [Gordonia defluvii]|uniref:Uncharacterized protein n=1 Tax=Gordonia defluvii TaxID=283718 RepID=A0ABP6L7N9_9ACTN
MAAVDIRSVSEPVWVDGTRLAPRVDITWPTQPVEYDGTLDVNKIADDVVARIHGDPVFAARVAASLGASDASGEEAPPRHP